MNRRTQLALFACVATTTACGGGGAGDILSGDGAGSIINEGGGNTAGPNLVEPLVGLWQLTSDWSLMDPDEALLVFRTPDEDDMSELVLYDFTDTDPSQCFLPPFGNGEAFTSLTDQVFLNSTDFNDGIVTTVDENTISIEFTDVDDIDGDGSTDDRVSTTLTRVAMAEADISPICT